MALFMGIGPRLAVMILVIEQLGINEAVFACNRSCKVFSVMRIDEGRADVRKFSRGNVYIRMEVLLKSVESKYAATV